jgi:hypothetical protein
MFLPLHQPELLPPSLVRGMMIRAYRSHRLKFRTFKYLLSRHSLEDLGSTISPHYLAFAQSVDSLLSKTSVDMDFDAVPWSPNC